MNISYIDPLSRAFRYMRNSLFHPFDISKWFIVGFSAFLAGLLDGWGDGMNWKGDAGKMDINRLRDLPYIVRDWITDNLEWSVLIALGIFIIILLFILITWLSSRGKFLFLENVVNNNTLIRKSWSNYADEADSLFLWRLVYGLTALLIIFSIIFYGIYYYEELKTLTIIGLVCLLLFTFVLFGYVSLFLNDFIVPIMYKHRISANDAWLKFILLFNETPIPFILYGLFVLFLVIVIVICVVAFGFLTCCIGFVLLAIPYIGSVIFLPVTYTFRAFSLAFLGQFDSQYKLLGEDITTEDTQI